MKALRATVTTPDVAELSAAARGLWRFTRELTSVVSSSPRRALRGCLVAWS